MRRHGILATFTAFLLAGAAGLARAQDAEPAIATVTVVNLMKGQILTPAVLITHDSTAPPLFVPGEPASSELAALAEVGRTSGLMNKFNAEVGVLSVTRLPEFIRPGQTKAVDIEFDARHRLVSSASMLEMTNDGFASLVAAEVPCEGARTYLLGAWDAGSEANTELCAHVPAPCPTPARSGSCAVNGDEGFVHVHSGIHGCGGFPSEIYDWGPEVAKVSIQVLPERSPAGALAAACPDQFAAEPEGSDGGDGDAGAADGG